MTGQYFHLSLYCKENVCVAWICPWFTVFIVNFIVKAIGIVLLSLLLTLNIFQTLFHFSIVNLEYVIAGSVNSH